MKTTWARVCLSAINILGVALFALSAYADDFNLDPEKLGFAMAGINIAILFIRQIQDPTTPTFPKE